MELLQYGHLNSVTIQELFLIQVLFTHFFFFCICFLFFFFFPPPPFDYPRSQFLLPTLTQLSAIAPPYLLVASRSGPVHRHYCLILPFVVLLLLSICSRLLFPSLARIPAFCWKIIFFVPFRPLPELTLFLTSLFFYFGPLSFLKSPSRIVYVDFLSMP